MWEQSQENYWVNADEEIYHLGIQIPYNGLWICSWKKNSEAITSPDQ